MYIGIVAGEASGDALGAGLIHSIKKLEPSAKFYGICGPNMCAEGAETMFPMESISIMGVDGLKLLEETVDRGIPTVMLTAHAISPETLMESIQKGAISYLPKETLADLDELLNDILGAVRSGEPPWKLLFEKLGDFFDTRFGAEWKDKDREFWSEFSSSYQISKGIQERLKHDRNIIDKGI